MLYYQVIKRADALSYLHLNWYEGKKNLIQMLEQIIVDQNPDFLSHFNLSHTSTYDLLSKTPIYFVKQSMGGKEEYMQDFHRELRIQVPEITIEPLVEQKQTQDYLEYICSDELSVVRCRIDPCRKPQLSQINPEVFLYFDAIKDVAEYYGREVSGQDSVMQVFFAFEIIKSMVHLLIYDFKKIKMNEELYASKALSLASAMTLYLMKKYLGIKEEHEEILKQYISDQAFPTSSALAYENEHLLLFSFDAWIRFKELGFKSKDLKSWYDYIREGNTDAVELLKYEFKNLWSDKYTQLLETKVRARQGDDNAQDELAQIYWYAGIPMSCHGELCEMWLNRAAAKGNANALCHLAQHELWGDMFTKNEERAITLLEESANKGCTEASYMLGTIKLGTGEYNAAEEYLLQAYQGGNKDACLYLGELYEKHFDTPNLQLALEWYEKGKEINEQCEYNAMRLQQLK